MTSNKTLETRKTMEAGILGMAASIKAKAAMDHAIYKQEATNVFSKAEVLYEFLKHDERYEISDQAKQAFEYINEAKQCFEYINDHCPSQEDVVTINRELIPRTKSGTVQEIIVTSILPELSSMHVFSFKDLHKGIENIVSIRKLPCDLRDIDNIANTFLACLCFKLCHDGYCVKNTKHVKKNNKSQSASKGHRSAESEFASSYHKKNLDLRWQKKRGEYADFLYEKKFLPCAHSMDPYERQLGGWAGTQRLARRNGKMSKERLDSLNAISGWYWGPNFNELDEVSQHSKNTLPGFFSRNSNIQEPMPNNEPSKIDRLPEISDITADMIFLKVHKAYGSKPVNTSFFVKAALDVGYIGVPDHGNKKKLKQASMKISMSLLKPMLEGRRTSKNYSITKSQISKKNILYVVTKKIPRIDVKQPNMHSFNNPSRENALDNEY